MLRLTRQMTTRACVSKDGSLDRGNCDLSTGGDWAYKVFVKTELTTNKSPAGTHCSLVFLYSAQILICWSTLVPNFKPNTNRGTNQTEYGSGVAGRHCGRCSVDCMGLLGWDATGPVLRGDAETRIVPEGTALFAFQADLDCT